MTLMSIKYMRVVLFGALWLWFMSGAHAASPPHAGVAKVWVDNGRLCLGAEPTYKVPGLFTSDASVAEHQVMLGGLLVHRENQVVWQIHAPSIEAISVRLQPETCLPYGSLPETMSEVIPAQPLQEGLYTVMFVARDEKNRRAWFYQRFCIGPNLEKLSIMPATFQADAGLWVCR